MMLFLGLGRMGLPMAQHAVRAGFAVEGYDPKPERMHLFEIAGGKCVSNFSASLREAESVMIMTGSERQVEDLFGDPGGILESCRPGTLIAVISTVSPEIVSGLGRKAMEKRIRVVDAPVCRAEIGAVSGTLLAFLSGPKSDCDEAAQLMRPFSADIEYVGVRLGAAQVAKTVNNLILWACVVANYEAFSLATTWNLDLAALRRALATSTADNWSLRHWDKVGEWPWSIKDMDIALRTASDRGVTLPLCERVSELVRTIEVLNHG